MDDAKKLVDLNEMAEQLNRRNEELRQIVRVEGNYIVINNSYDYNIEISRCNTPEKLLAWIRHLCEKEWMEFDILERFIDTAREHGADFDPHI